MTTVTPEEMVYGYGSVPEAEADMATSEGNVHGEWSARCCLDWRDKGRVHASLQSLDVREQAEAPREGGKDVTSWS
ncbi:hypothetical protein BDN70DRAFT_888826 [Pholiota conissans]|uniref:Uncharacterized protein n=1 Tax=Pholiota conissans TaxID=109636 RepID=A0A9P5YMW9_9AGAR|nr:hypothetical protein BDN70DRAFT_888826 [Pholiota conissans]